MMMMMLMTVMLKGCRFVQRHAVASQQWGQQPQLPVDDVALLDVPTNDQTHLTAYNSILVFGFWVSSALYYMPLLIKFFCVCVYFMYACMYVYQMSVYMIFVTLNYGNNSVLVTTVKLCIDGFRFRSDME